MSKSIDQPALGNTKNSTSLSANSAAKQNYKPVSKDQPKAMTLSNRPYDEAVDISDDESFSSDGSAKNGHGKKPSG